MDLSLSFGQIASYNIGGLDSDSNPTDLAGATLAISNSNTSVVTASIDSTGLLDIVPVGVTGTSTIVVSTSDSYGNSISTSLTVTVTGPPQPLSGIQLLLAIKAYTSSGANESTTGS